MSVHGVVVLQACPAVRNAHRISREQQEVFANQVGMCEEKGIENKKEEESPGIAAWSLRVVIH
jgi:hypothetical protein